MAASKRSTPDLREAVAEAAALLREAYAKPLGDEPHAVMPSNVARVIYRLETAAGIGRPKPTPPPTDAAVVARWVHAVEDHAAAYQRGETDAAEQLHRLIHMASTMGGEPIRVVDLEQVRSWLAAWGAVRPGRKQSGQAKAGVTTTRAILKELLTLSSGNVDTYVTRTPRTGQE